jgi:hypothetical protein
MPRDSLATPCGRRGACSCDRSALLTRSFEDMLRFTRHSTGMWLSRMGAIFALAGIACAQPPVISVDRQTIAAGESATLTWRSKADSAFISGLGKVEPSGRKTVVPDESADFVLITQAGARIESAVVHIRVEGQKGASAFPDPDEFPRGASGEHPPAKYPDFLAFAFGLLQNQMRFRVKGDFLPGRSFQTLYTDMQPRPELLKDNPPGIRQRRIAYAVELEQPGPPGTLAFRVKTLVEYQRIAESRWRPESDAQVGLAAAQELMNRLAGAAVK